MNINDTPLKKGIINTSLPVPAAKLTITEVVPGKTAVIKTSDPNHPGLPVEFGETTLLTLPSPMIYAAITAGDFTAFTPDGVSRKVGYQINEGGVSIGTGTTEVPIVAGPARLQLPVRAHKVFFPDD